MVVINVKIYIQKAIGILFISTSILKMLSFTQFMFAVHNFNYIPKGLILPLSILIIAVEIIAGIGLLINGYVKTSYWLLICLLTVFTFAIIFNLLNNNLAICGCFGDLFKDTINWWSVARNASLIIVMILIVHSEGNN